VVTSTAGWLAGVTSGQAEGAARVAQMVGGAICVVVATGVPLWQQARESRARADAVAVAQNARASMRIAMEDALDPFVGLLLQLATAKGAEKARLRGEATQLALTTIAQLGAARSQVRPGEERRLRVCWFELRPGPPRTLEPQSYAGRAGAPTVTLDSSSRAGQFLLRIADNGWQLVDDVSTLRVPVWWDDEHSYRTFAAGPLPGPDGAPVGLVTVDALEPGALTRLDVPLLRLLTHMLSLALRL
jgi:hypothetical protein